MRSVKNSMGVCLMLRIIFLDGFYCFTLKIVSGILLYSLHKALNIFIPNIRQQWMKIMNDLL